jgi:putative SOS response-associated peptidase YedK
MAFAGLWETWKGPRDNPLPEPLLSFSIATTWPNRTVEPYHDRMPVAGTKIVRRFFRTKFERSDGIVPERKGPRRDLAAWHRGAKRGGGHQPTRDDDQAIVTHDLVLFAERLSCCRFG